MEIVTIIGDSLSVVRGNEGISYKDTYAYILNELLGSNFHVVNRSRGANTTKLVKETYIDDDINFSNSSYFVFQLGIVDCAPRLFAGKEEFIIRHLIRPKSFAQLIIKFKSKYRRFFTKNFPKVYVDKCEFKKNYEYLINQAINISRAKIIYIINIADTNNINKYRSYGFEKQIQEYNGILKELSEKYKNYVVLFDLYKLTKENLNEFLLSDGIHITKKAHLEIANWVYQNIKTNQNSCH